MRSERANEERLFKEKLIDSENEITLEIVQEKAVEFRRLLSYYRCALMEVETKFRVLNEEFSLKYDRNPISSIKTRIKSVPSIIEKLERLKLPFDIDNIENYLNDIAGIRVTCPFPDDVYLLADSLLKQDDIMLIRKKDYIEHPKENGYRSLHLIIAVPIYLAHEKRLMKVEIQLRTLAMDFWASLEHQLRYKKDFEFTEEMAKELFECAEQSAALDKRMDELRKKVMNT